MPDLIVYQIDAFTKEKFSGNPAGVVMNSEGLSDLQMLQIARELNNSETAFLFPPGNENADCIIRYFTPYVEVPVCGHATIAAMYAWALAHNLASRSLRLKTSIGILPIDIERIDDDYQIFMTQGKIEFGKMLEGKNKTELLAALGLSEADLDDRCPLQIVSTGHSKVMIGVKYKVHLNGLQPDFNALKSLSHEIGCNGFYVFTLDSGSADTLVCGRMFAPAIGINEDPVTGNANGPLGAYLVFHKIVKVNSKIFEFKASQGEAMGRLGHINVQVEIKQDQPVAVKISGCARVVFKTVISVTIHKHERNTK